MERIGNLTEFNIDQQLCGFDDYIGLLTTMFAREQERVNQWVAEQTKSMTEDEIYDFEMQNYSELNNCGSFPRLFLYSAVGTIWSFIEQELISLCNQDMDWRVREGLPRLPEADKLMFGGDAVKYWIACGVIMPPSWELMESIKDVRNHIIHNNGMTVDKPVGLKRKATQAEDRTIRIREFLRVRREAGIKTLDSEGRSLVVTPEYCRELIASAQQFFRDMLQLLRGAT